ncbi:MAG: hypothetical protein LAO21_04700 [Acidobacteriia bacterium]|nr:hypothetical protein [Terriglobia bacterium]
MLKFDTLDASEQTLLKVHARFSEFSTQGDPKGMQRCRELILKGKKRAQMIARNKKVHSGKRAEKAEIAQWFTVWLQTPDIFVDWLILRKRSREFQEHFGGGGEEHSP